MRKMVPVLMLITLIAGCSAMENKHDSSDGMMHEKKMDSMGDMPMKDDHMKKEDDMMDHDSMM